MKLNSNVYELVEINNKLLNYHQFSILPKSSFSETKTDGDWMSIIIRYPKIRIERTKSMKRMPISRLGYKYRVTPGNVELITEEESVVTSVSVYCKLKSLYPA